jgi:hypothetical protein
MIFATMDGGGHYRLPRGAPAQFRSISLHAIRLLLHRARPSRCRHPVARRFPASLPLARGGPLLLRPSSASDQRRRAGWPGWTRQRTRWPAARIPRKAPAAGSALAVVPNSDAEPLTPAVAWRSSTRIPETNGRHGWAAGPRLMAARRQ